MKKTQLLAFVLLVAVCCLERGNLYAAATTVALNAQQDQVCRGVVLDT